MELRFGVTAEVLARDGAKLSERIERSRDWYEANLRSPILRSWADDHNRDGTPDALHVFLRFPLNEGEHIHQVTSVATFDYQLRDRRF